MPTDGGPLSGGSIKDDRISDWEAGWRGFKQGLTAGWYTVVDTFTPDSLLDVSAPKEQAWKAARLNGTWTQTISEGAANFSREAAIAAVTGGLGNIASASRAAAVTMVGVRGALIAREGYEAVQNGTAAFHAFSEGHIGSGLYHSAMFGLNILGAKAGISQLKNDVKLAFPTSPVPSPKCFVAGTLISTEHGLKAIESVQIGEQVWGCDLTTGAWRLRPVLDTFVFNYDQELIEVTVAGERIQSTEGHPFWVIEGDELASRPRPEHIARIWIEDTTVPGRWVDSHDLQPGDVLLLKGSKPARITAVGRHPSPSVVYNFAVDDLHCYAVGVNRILVHNDCNFISIESLEIAAKNGRMASSVTANALTNEAKDALRESARDIWQLRSGRRAIWDGLDVHHRIPLEWAHLFAANPNRVANLIGMTPTNHSLVTQTWNAWRKGLNGRMPTQAEVMKQALRMDEQFGKVMRFLP